MLPAVFACPCFYEGCAGPSATGPSPDDTVGAYPQHPLPPSDSSRNESESDPAEACLLNPSNSPGAQHRGPPAHGAGVLCNPLHTGKGSHPHGCSGPPFQMCPFSFQGTAASHKFKRSCNSSLLRQLVTNSVTVKLVAHNLVTSCRGGSWKSYWIYFGCRKGGCCQRRGCQRWCPGQMSTWTTEKML
ncbi:hypothetical protein LEMLEM_LOCUS12237 [Lemmus lemmus]